ncbi:MAG: MFS transporter [Anaerolineaceae bacterium]|nr:MFS transporter [Anaerolineaceae bacterium]
MSRDLLLVVLSLFFWGIGEGMFIYFQPLYLQQWGANPLAIGAILGGVGIAMGLAQVPAGYLGDRIGTRPIMWASWIMGALTAWLMALANSLTVYTIGLLAYWLTSAVLAPMNSYITHARGNWSVGRALTVASGVFQLGGVIGPLVGGALGQHYGLKTVYFVAAGVIIVSLGVVLFIHPQPIIHRVPGEKSSHLLKNRRFLAFLAVASLAMFATYLPQPLTPNFLQNQRGLSLTQIGQLGAIGSLGNAAIVLGFGHIFAPVAFLTGQVSVAIFSIALWHGTGFFWYGLGYFFFGGYRLCRSMASVLTRPLIPLSEVGFAFGMLESANAGAVILAPLLAGVLYSSQPTLIYPVSLGFLTLSLATGVWFFASRHSPIGAEDVS